VQKRIYRVVECIIITLLQIVCRVCQWKNFENWSIIVEDIDKVPRFLWPTVYIARRMAAHYVGTGSTFLFGYLVILSLGVKYWTKKNHVCLDSEIVNRSASQAALNNWAATDVCWIYYGVVLPRRRPHCIDAVRLSVCPVPPPRGKTKRPTNTKLRRKGPRDTSTPWTNFKVKGSKVKVTGHSSCVNVSLIIRISRWWLVDSRI